MHTPTTTLFLALLAATISAAQTLTIDLYHSNRTCLSNAAGDITHTAIAAGSGCQSVLLFPEGSYTAPGAFSAKVSSIDPTLVLKLFDDTACTDTTPDVVKGDGSTGCAPSAVSGAGWMSFLVEKA